MLKVPCSYKLLAVGKFALLMYMSEFHSTPSLVVLFIGNSKSNHLGAQGTYIVLAPHRYLSTSCRTCARGSGIVTRAGVVRCPLRYVYIYVYRVNPQPQLLLFPSGAPNVAQTTAPLPLRWNSGSVIASKLTRSQRRCEARPELRTRLVAVRGVPKGALRTHSA